MIVNRLSFIDEDNLQVLCIKCHKQKSKEENKKRREYKKKNGNRKKN